MHSSKLKKISVALCMVMLPITVYAAGLGKLNVQSGIGEPLKADIELISVSPEEISSIVAAIASEEAYAAQGIERPASHNNIKVTVATNTSGTPILKLNSSQPISEPFLDMLLQVDWNSGRLLREYTVLLDPPGYTGESDASTQPISTAQTPVVKSSNMAATPEANMVQDAPVATKKSGRKHRARATPAPGVEASTAGADSTGQEYVTQKGDTLAKIARDMKPDGVSLDQMLVGLYQANPDAFSGDNMNRLNVGKIIRPPTADELNAVTSQDAKKEIKVQTADWNAYRNKLAGIVAESTPAADSEASTQSSGGKIKTAAEDKSMPASTGPKDVVKLSAGDVKNDAVETKALQAKVTALQEEAIAREKSLKDAQERTAALEKQIADMQKLIAMKSNAMAEAQKQAEAAKPTPVEPVKPAEVKPAEVKPTEVTATPGEPAKPEVKSEQKPAVTAPVAVPTEQPGFLASMLDGVEPTILGGAGGLLALLGGGWMYLRNKRKKNLADFEQGIMTSGGLKANTVFGNTSGSSVDTGDTSFLTDFSQSANGGMIDTNDVDPIAEAEVYMAYGRDAQAEEILKDAITKEPKRYELHLKLLEMYAASKNMSAFEAVSGELYTTLGADDPTWAKVAEIGSKLEPSNPLYHANSSPTGASAAKVAADEGKLDASDFSGSPLAAEKDLDLSMGADTLPNAFATEAPVVSAEMNELQMDKGTGESGDFDGRFAGDEFVDAPVTTDAEMPVITSTIEDSGLDFSMAELGTGADESALMASPGFSHTMPDLDFPKFETEEPVSATNEISLTNDALPSLETEEITPMMVAEAPVADNFEFDITTITPDTSHADEAKMLDLSGITLEMGDSAEAAVNLTSESSGDEPAEVETKLELVAAYIEMDDKEGAKELLDEVMKEGGAQQRKRAEALLTQIA